MGIYLYAYWPEYELTTNLKWQTVAWLQELWWQWIQWVSWYSLDGNGLKNWNSTNNWVQLTFDLTQYDLTWKKLTLYQEWNLVSTATYAWVARFKLASGYEWTITNYSTMVWWWSPNNIDTSGLFIWGSQKVWSWTPWSWDYTAKLEMNFSTWETKIKITWTQSVDTTYTMSSSEIQTVLQTQYVLFYTTNYSSWYQNTITLASIKIE